MMDDIKDDTMVDIEDDTKDDIKGESFTECTIQSYVNPKYLWPSMEVLKQEI